MGYGNPLFDGDQPLPPARPRPRILSMRLWLGAVLAGTLGNGSALAQQEEELRSRDSESEWRHRHGEGTGHR